MIIKMKNIVAGIPSNDIAHICNKYPISVDKCAKKGMILRKKRDEVGNVE